MKDCFFRIDGASFIGYGHLYRSFVLAKELSNNGMKCIYLIRNLDDNALGLIEKQGFDYYTIVEQYTEKDTWQICTQGFNKILELDYDETLSFAKNNILVVDNYSISSDYLNRIRNNVHLLIAFDDINDRHYPVDILINQNFRAEQYSFSTLPQTKLLAGLKYTLIREKFFEAKCESDQNYLLIMLGATDAKNHSEFFLEILKDVDIHIKIIVGRGNKNKNYLKKKFDCYDNIDICKDPTDVEKIMARAKRVITAAGSSVWELCFLNKQFLVIKIADNQTKIVDELTKIGLTQELKVSEKHFKDKIISFYKNGLPVTQKQVLVDGNGKRRIAEVILKRGIE